MKTQSRNLRETSLGELPVLDLLEQVRLPLCLSNPTHPDNPIVYANGAFLEMSGYSEAEVLGRNCRFLQGGDTDPASIEEIRAALREERLAIVEVVNYRKDGTRFVNALQIGPIHDDEGRVALHFGSQLDVTAKRAAETAAAELDDQEQSHRLRNIVNVMAGVIRMTAREADDVPSFALQLTERLHLLGQAHFDTFSADDRQASPLADVARIVMKAYAPLGPDQYSMDGPDRRLSRAQITPMTLVLHELATNSVKHGALGSESGRIALDWKAEPPGRTLITWREIGGPPVEAPTRASGSRIIRSLLGAIGGDLRLDWRPDGLVAEIELPA